MDDIQPLLAYNTWLSLSRETRLKLVKLFEIPRTGETVVRSGSLSPQGNIQGEVTSDGHSAKDLYAITIEKMQSFTGSDSADFYQLFKYLVDNLDDIIGYEAIEPEVLALVETAMIELPKKNRGRPKGSKNNKKDGKTTTKD